MMHPRESFDRLEALRRRSDDLNQRAAARQAEYEASLRRALEAATTPEAKESARRRWETYRDDNRRHRVSLELIEERGQAEIATIRERQADDRRKKEAATLSSHKDRVEREKRLGAAIPLADYIQRQEVMLGTLDVGVDPLVPRYRAHIETLAATHHITIEYGALPASNAYAWSCEKRVDIQRIVSATGYAIALHEIGHCVHPCELTHVRVKSSSGVGTLCVRCELAAWTFAMRTAQPAWTLEMHREMGTALTTYRKYGIPDEQAEIDVFVSRPAFRTALVRRWREETV